MYLFTLTCGCLYLAFKLYFVVRGFKEISIFIQKVWIKLVKSDSKDIYNV